jgi:hypothetical protein
MMDIYISKTLIRSFLKAHLVQQRIVEENAKGLHLFIQHQRQMNAPFRGKARDFCVGDICGFSDLTLTHKHTIHLDLHSTDDFCFPF